MSHSRLVHDNGSAGIVLRRLAGFLYGIVVYAFFLAIFMYAIGFVSCLVAPKNVDSGVQTPLAAALVIDLALMSLFAIQHSVMARRWFKRWWTRFVPQPVERSTYVLFATLALLLLLWQWRPIPQVVWHVANPAAATILTGLSLGGWLLVLFSTFLINHFELFGLHQVTSGLLGREMNSPTFKTPLLYKIVRHPIYLGFIVAFWSAPTMTAGHLLFAAVTTAYIFVGIALEERDLIALFGDDYRRYRQRVGMMLPFRRP